MDTSLVNYYDTIIAKVYLQTDTVKTVVQKTTESNECSTFIKIITIAALVLAIVGFLILIRSSKKNLASEKLCKQIIGAMFQWRPKHFLIFLVLLVPTFLVSQILSPCQWIPCLWLIGINLIVWMTIKVCRQLTDIFSLRKQDTGITWCYVSILIAIGVWILAFVLIYNTKDDPKVAAAITVIGTVLSIVFKDKISGVVAFLHLRMHHLLNIGDWIKVPKLDVDGEVKRVTLTSVTIYNWDTTTSVIPISALHSDHFKNLQNMMEGKTYGRRMYMSFIFDTEWFHTISEQEVAKLNANEEVMRYLPKNEVTEGNLNARLYRLYLYHWLMNHKHISQQPRMIVRWQDQMPEGMPLQVYAFIIDSSLATFEWQQSQIVEHIINSMEPFGLRLYQRPSGYDASNNNIFMTNKPAQYGKEEM